MTDKLLYAADYLPEHTELVKQSLLYLATFIGEFLDDIVIVGGLVPGLLIPSSSLPQGEDHHLGTMDLDIGLSIALLDGARYDALSDRLKRAGFVPDTSDKGHPTIQRWIIKTNEEKKVVVDILIPQVKAEDEPGTIFHLTIDLGAIITPGLQLAFADYETKEIEGITIKGEKVCRKVKVCGPGAFIVLKALAFNNRGERKDAYDLYFTIKNYKNGVDDVFDHLKPLLDDPIVKNAIDILRKEFSGLDGLGPMRVAEFFGDPDNYDIRADVIGFVQSLVSKYDEEREKPR
jgi:hypothetical protein